MGWLTTASKIRRQEYSTNMTSSQQQRRELLALTGLEQIQLPCLG